MGTGQSINPVITHSISDNLKGLQEQYPYKNGYFGIEGQGTKYTRNIICKNPIQTAKNFYKIAIKGGISQPMKNGKGYLSRMLDGTIVSYREVSTSDGSPIVEINIRRSVDSGGIRHQKIHFFQENK